MRRPGFTGDIWPDEIQELLLRAALLSGDRGLRAWAEVRPRIDVDHLPGELHRLMPMLSKALTVRDVDDPDLPRLKGVYQFSWYRNTMLWADAVELLRALDDVAIDTMLLRGAVLATAYRGDAGLRPMNDVDILVRPIDLERARAVADAAGWQPVDPTQPLERRIAAAPVRNSASRVVRLHWEPSANLSLPGVAWDGVWQRATSVRVGDLDIRMPSAADHLVHACVDGARANSGASLRWIADSVTLLTAPAAHVDWDVVVSEARRLRVVLLITEALRYLDEALDAEVPPQVLAALVGTPTTRRDRLAHRLSLTTTPRLASAGEIVGRFTRFTAHLPLVQAGAHATEFLATVLSVERHRDLPLTALSKVFRAAMSPVPPRASLSRAGAAATTRRDDPPRKVPDGRRLSAH